MPEDVGGTPSPDGREPDDDRDHGRADEEFAAVVFDEDFVRSAAFHEPSAVERLLAAAQARAEAEHRRRGRTRREHPDDLENPDGYDDAYDRLDGGYANAFGHDPDRHDPYGPHGLHGHGDHDEHDDHADRLAAGRRTPGRWHRPVAWVLALVMGIGMVALAFTAVYRGTSTNRQDPVPSPTTSGVDSAPSVPVGPPAPGLHADRSTTAP